jgi:hypothetical protein
LRKTLVAAIAALTVVGGTTAALAQTATGPTLTVAVKPTKAGTKKKPKNSSIHLVVVNNDSKRTLSTLTITMPKTLKVSGKGFKTCSEATLNDTSKGPSSCPAGSKVGSGSSDALLGVNTGSPTPLHFVVTAFVGGKSKINFYLHSTGVPVNVVAPGRVSGHKLIVTVPQVAQQPVPGTFAGLVKLDTTLKGKAKKHLLISSIGCKGGKDAFKAALTFANNGVSPAGTVNTSGSAKCKK